MANQNMNVRFRVQGVDASVSQIDRLADAMRRLAEAQSALGGGASLGMPGGGGGGSRAGGGGAGGRGGGRSSFMSRLNGVIGSTRVNMGPVSPLIGRMGRLFGSGPLALAFNSASVAAVGLAAAMMRAQEAVATFASAATTGGGTAGQVAQLARFGFGPQEAAQAANSYRERAGDVMVQVARSQLGLGYMLPEPYGPSNNIKVFQETLERLQGVQDPSRQFRLARMLGPEFVEALESFKVSPDVKAFRSRQASRIGDALDPAALQGARDFQATLKDIGSLFQEMAMILQNGIVVNLLKGFRDALDSFVTGLYGFTKSVTQVVTYLGALFAGFGFDGAKQAYDLAGMAFDAMRAADAMKSNTDAINNNTAATWALNKGISGGGQRARNALPPGLTGKMMSDAIQGRNAMLGAWRL